MNTNKGIAVVAQQVDLVLIGVPVLGGAWWAFRPEKAVHQPEGERGGASRG